MEREARRRVLRREVLGLLGGALAVPAGRRASAAERDGWWLGLPSARELAGDAPSETGLLIDLPFLVEDGASVPLRVVVNRPMTPRSHVASLHCFALGNPIREIADCFFSPRSGRAEVATRIRLDDTQSVAAVAVTSDGEAIVARARSRSSSPAA